MLAAHLDKKNNGKVLEGTHCMKLAWRSATTVLHATAVVVLLASSPSGSAADNGGAPARRVLVLQGLDPWLPATVMREQAMRQVLSRAPGMQLEIISEHVDGHRFPRSNPDVESTIVALLAEKYRGLTMDIIVAVGKPGLDFAARHRGRLWPHTPIVFVSIAREQLRDAPLPPDTTGVLTSLDVDPTITLARRLQPNARRVIVVGGSSPSDQLRVQAAVDAVRRAGLEVVRLDDKPLGEVLAALKASPRDDVIFFANFLRDVTGTTYVPRQVLAQLSAAAAAPMYANISTMLGEGVVGGVFNDFAADGERVATMVLDVLHGRLRPDAPPMEPSRRVCSIDARQMERWGLREGAVPGECTMQFESHGLWARHRLEFLTGIVLILVQGVLIGMLLRQRRRTREAAMEAHRMRGELAHASRLATIGELTAAISHELNQPLGAVQSNADAAEMLLDGAEPRLDRVRQVLHDIRAANLRASEVVQRLRALLLKQESRFEAVDLAQVVDAVVALTGHEFARRGVTVSTVVSGRPLALRGDVVQLQQVLLNLLINAMDAVADKPAERRRVRIGARRSGTHALVVEVADTGSGIAPLDLPRLFESFRSSKKNGMGLGLSISRSIVQAHGGQIAAANNDDGGATFTVTLPATRRAAETRAARRLAALEKV